MEPWQWAVIIKDVVFFLMFAYLLYFHYKTKSKERDHKNSIRQLGPKSYFDDFGFHMPIPKKDQDEMLETFEKEGDLIVQFSAPLKSETVNLDDLYKPGGMFYEPGMEPKYMFDPELAKLYDNSPYSKYAEVLMDNYLGAYSKAEADAFREQNEQAYIDEMNDPEKQINRHAYLDDADQLPLYTDPRIKNDNKESK